MKKVEFGKLKPGQKFRYQRKLYVKDNEEMAVRLSNGKVFDFYITSREYNTLVTPVKVRITVK